MSSSVFKDGKMVGSLTGEETRFSMTLRPVSRVEIMMSNFQDPLSEKDRIVAKVKRRRNNKVKMDLSGEYPRIDIAVHMDVEVVSIASFIDYVENLDNQKILKESVEKYFKKEATALIEKTQKEFRAEPFMWSTYIRRQFLTTKEYKAYRWNEKYPKAIINVDFDVILIDFGKENRPPDIDILKD